AVAINQPAGVKIQYVNTERTISEDLDYKFIQELYLSRLKRLASEADVAAWEVVLHGPGGRLAVTVGIEQSLEARTRLVRSWYQDYLGRPATGDEQGWVAMLMNGKSEEEVLAGIISSDEFLSRTRLLIHSGLENERFVRLLYNLLFNRLASDAEVTGWLSVLTKTGRDQVVCGVRPA